MLQILIQQASSVPSFAFLPCLALPNLSPPALRLRFIEDLCFSFLFLILSPSSIIIIMLLAVIILITLLRLNANGGQEKIKVEEEDSGRKKERSRLAKWKMGCYNWKNKSIWIELIKMESSKQASRFLPDLIFFVPF